MTMTDSVGGWIAVWIYGVRIITVILLAGHDSAAGGEMGGDNGK